MSKNVKIGPAGPPRQMEEISYSKGFLKFIFMVFDILPTYA